MRIAVFSDLHLETLNHYPQWQCIPEPADDTDLIILAGDIHSGTRGLEALARHGSGHIYVSGNHEYYHHDVELLDVDLRVRARELGLHYLQRQSVEIGGVRFLGTTLWTDFAVQAGWTWGSQLIAQAFIPDFRLIRYRGRRFTPLDAMQLHQNNRSWLEAELRKPFAGRTVVVTHHAPHVGSIHPRFAMSPVNAAFVSDLSHLVDLADVWIHGHMHDSFDYRTASGTRVFVNPRGYVRKKNAKGPQQFENRAFSAHCVIEL
jgi:predicted phosphodiesterase